MLKNSCAALLICFLLSSCLKAPKCDYDECAYSAPTAEVQALQNYITSNSITAIQHCSGVFYTIVNPGTGKSPNACSNILARYKGTLLSNGSVFDESTSGAYFSLGGLIPAWRNVIPLLKEGGKIIMYVPPYLAYGDQTVGTIPGGSYLAFEVDLDAVQ